MRRFVLQNSLQFRIRLLLIGVGIVPALFLVLVMLYFFEARLTTQEVSRIASQAGMLSGELLSGAYLEGGNDVETLNAELTSVADAYNGRIIVVDASLRIVRDTYDMYEGRTFLWENVIRASNGESVTYFDRNNDYLILASPIIARDEEEARTKGVLIMMESTEALYNSVDYVNRVAFVVMLVVILVSVSAGIFLPPWLVGPLHNVADAIDNMEKSTEDGISVMDYTETQEICRSFNRYHERRQTLDDSRQEFVSNVSHELKTPLTSMKVLADTINGMGDAAPIEMYREFMGDITNEIDRETKTINDLLALVRMDKSKADLNITVVNINELLELLLKRLQPLAVRQEVDIVLESFRPVTAEVDEVKFTLAIMNLIENAIKYNSKGGWVHVSINSDHQYCFIRVEDNGMGIEKEDLEHIFERFYRADKSHSQEIGGTGLGLAITWDAIALHHGEIRVASTPKEGTTFDVRIPLSYIGEEEERL